MINRFLKYVKIATDSNPENLQCPSSDIQWDLGKVIVEDLKELGLEDISLDENCYIMATLPANCTEKIPSIGFIAHMDTAPTYNGIGVNPRIVKYEGGDIVLNKELNIILSPKDFSHMNNYIGQDLIVTDGKTLLGADDKAGIVEIIEAIKYLKEHPEIKHGEIKIGFTPDEEIGRGANFFDVEKFNCKFAYTVDGGELGELEYENFNAASAVIKIKGRDIHPGTAKNSMINSIMIAMELNSMLPPEQRPEHTENYEGFFLLNDMKGTVEDTTMNYIIRDHSMKKFNEKKNLIKAAVMYLQLKYKDACIEIEVKDSYYNMREKIEPVMYVIDLAKKSMEELGIEPHIRPIRGGTDGARLSYKGLPCPNLFTGGHNFHGKFEYISVQSMEKARDLIVKIIENTAKL
ncbi:MAG: peptidase T [Fusobacterium mortiferum]|jgi:tripeptide aminopeptidase|uniref:Peptidase T n=2 Tax=Fusobacterium mortiferum TaxID=850 RepID=A0A414PRD9_FUSMR|nr:MULTISPECIES: peptidase T [Fusobacterium]AVQ19251.1 peptidase T [Fusobacterium mortiferum ATCC 9817]EEO36347.1 peptidase T [Fusobacterium mortiferum ATCC 9817]MCF2628730.1 peptidase T [Fusobacterium mortiferum]MCF2700269.1 peptidase T [Fusobacterium mortiferum]MCI6382203.1 peptidase T [Fusobacterium mortiferum]